MPDIVFEVSFAWWFRWYALGVAAMCRLTGMPANEERFLYWANKATRIRFVEARQRQEACRSDKEERTKDEFQHD